METNYIKLMNATMHILINKRIGGKCKLKATNLTITITLYHMLHKVI